MNPSRYIWPVNDDERRALIADQAAVLAAEQALAEAIRRRNERMRNLKAAGGYGTVTEMAKVLGFGRVTVAKLVGSPGSGSKGRRPRST